MIAVLPYSIPQISYQQQTYSTCPTNPHDNALTSYKRRLNQRRHDDLRSKLRNKVRDRQVEQLKSIIRYTLFIQHHLLSKMSTNYEIMNSLAINELPVNKFKRILEILSTITLDKQMISSFCLGLRHQLKNKLCLMVLNFVLVGCCGSLMMEFNMLGQLVLVLLDSVAAEEKDFEFIKMGTQLVYKIVKSQDRRQLGQINLVVLDQLLLGLLNLSENHVHIKQKVLNILAHIPSSNLNHVILKYRPRQPITKLRLLNFMSSKHPTYIQYHQKQLLSLYAWMMKGNSSTTNQIQRQLIGQVKQLASLEIHKILKTSWAKDKNFVEYKKNVDRMEN